MSVDIRNRNALRAVSPTALSAYARSAGWRRVESFGAHSDVYAGDDKPEVIVPRTDRLGDYARVVAQLIKTFSEVAAWDQLSIYRTLVTVDRDVVRVRVTEGDDGSLSVNDGVDLIGGARDMLLATACSLRNPQPVYRAGANNEASDLLKNIRLGQTDQGSFAITLLTPVLPPPFPALVPDPDDHRAPIHRLMTKRLIEALTVTRDSAERATAGDEGAFANAVDCGVSANLCDAMVRLIEPFPEVDVSVSWARTRPMTSASSRIRFSKSDLPILREAARSVRERAPRLNEVLCGFVRLLRRAEAQEEGAVGLSTKIGGQRRSVTTVLEKADYEMAVRAHGIRAPVVVTGDLERIGQRWWLLNPHLTDVIAEEPTDDVFAS